MESVQEEVHDSVLSFVGHEAECAEERSMAMKPKTPVPRKRVPSACHGPGGKPALSLGASFDVSMMSSSMCSDTEHMGYDDCPNCDVLRDQVAMLQNQLAALKSTIIADLTHLRTQSKQLPATPAIELEPDLSPIPQPSPDGDPTHIQYHLFENKKVIKPGKAKASADILIEATYEGRPVELLLLHNGTDYGHSGVHLEMLRHLKSVAEDARNLLKFVGGAYSPLGLYAVAERCDGSVTLQQYTKRRFKSGNGFSAAEVVVVARKIAEGLKTLHEHGITHRDLSSLQIVIQPTPYITASTGVWVRRYGLTRAPPLLEFTSPESVNSRTFSKENDVWSFGVVLWELVTYCNEQAFKGTTQKAVQDEILEKATSGTPLFTCPPACPSTLWDPILAPCFLSASTRPSIPVLLDKIACLKIPSNLDIPLPMDDLLFRNM